MPATVKNDISPAAAPMEMEKPWATCSITAETFSWDTLTVTAQHWRIRKRNHGFFFIAAS